MSDGGGRWAVCASMLLFGACGPATEDGVPAPVGHAAQALGNFDETWEGPMEVPLAIDEHRALFFQGPTGCATHVVSVDPETGASFEMPFEVTDCRNPNGAASDSDEVFVQEREANDILRFVIGASTPGWTKIADTSGAPTGKLLLGSSHVYWSDTAGIRRAPRSGGAATTLKSGTGLILQAIDGGSLYFTQPGSSTIGIRRMPVGGGTDVVMAARNGLVDSLSFDANYLYWSENSEDTGRIVRVSKTTHALNIVTSSSENLYYAPRSNGSALYYTSVGPDGCQMHRRNLVNQNVVKRTLPSCLSDVDMRIAPNGVQVTGVTYTQPLFLHGKTVVGDL